MTTKQAIEILKLSASQFVFGDKSNNHRNDENLAISLIEDKLDAYKSLIKEIEKEIEDCAYIFRNDLAELSAYNDGVIATLDFFINKINKYRAVKIEPIIKNTILKITTSEELK